MADPKLCQGGTQAPLGPNSFVFMQFSVKVLQNNRLARHSQEILVPSPGVAKDSGVAQTY